MRLPIPIIFIWFIIFLVYLAFKRTKQTQNQQNANQSFLERERLANNTRKKDISGLNYLPFTTDRLPDSVSSDEKLNIIESELKELSNQKIINLSQYSNTDLKLMYGPANLPALSEYDDNYHRLAALFLDYASRQLELCDTSAAIAALEYAAELRIQSSRIYLLLAELYLKQGTPEKINTIRDTVSSMEEPFRRLVLPKLDQS